MMITLAASYPGGAVGYVTVQAAVHGDELSLNHDPGFQAILADMVRLYHILIGPAYSINDFTYTIFLVDDLEELFHLCGPRLLATDGVVADYQRPEVGW
jgi:hypothetical protein